MYAERYLFFYVCGSVFGTYGILYVPMWICIWYACGSVRYLVQLRICIWYGRYVSAELCFVCTSTYLDMFFWYVCRSVPIRYVCSSDLYGYLIGTYVCGYVFGLYADLYRSY